MRSAEAYALLVAHDIALPGLSALLDDAVLSERLGAPSTRTYLRYKTGTNAVALVDVGGRAAIANAWPAGGGPKRTKALKHVTPDDVLLDAPDEGLLVVDAMADRRLPALRHLVRTGRVAPWLAEHGLPVDPHTSPRTLAHKPGRRWVGRLPLTGERAGEHVVLRAYRSDEFDAALAAHHLIDPSRCPSVRLPRILRTHRRGLIALAHLPGRTLDATVDATSLRRLGASLGELHASRARVSEAPTRSVGPRPTRNGGLEPVTFPTGLDVIAPVLGTAVDDAADVHAAASAALRPSPGSIIHGDLSLDQVIADGDTLGIIDLDRVRVGNPLDDVASLLAMAALGALPSGGALAGAELVDRLRDPFLAGHASTWTGRLGDDLGPRTALALLDRVGEPFRSGCPDWPEVTRELISLAGVLAGAGGEA